jgi:hypothetical protein
MIVGYSRAAVAVTCPLPDFWLDPSNSGTLTLSGSNVTQIVDISSNALVLTAHDAAGSSASPQKYNPTSRTVVYMPGNSYFSMSGTVDLTSGYTYIGVVKPSASYASTVLFETLGSSSDAKARAAEFDPGDAYANNASGFRKALMTLGDGNFHVLAARLTSSGSGKIWIDGVEAASSFTSLVEPSPVFDLFGAGDGTGSSFPANARYGIGTFGEQEFYTSAIPESCILSETSYLMSKWSISAQTQRTVVFLEAGTSYVIPSDFSAPWSIEAIGGGASGGATASPKGAPGGGGGAWAKITDSDLTLTPGQTVHCQIGQKGGASPADGTDTWLNATVNSPPGSTSAGVLAKAGATGITSNGGLGGAASSSIGSSKHDGGDGGSAVTSTGGAAGGGGAGGPYAAGGHGGWATGKAGAGGGANSTQGQDATDTPGKGGASRFGVGVDAYYGNGGDGAGGTGTAENASAHAGHGSYEPLWVQTSDSAWAGPGSGGGGSGKNATGAAGIGGGDGRGFGAGGGAIGDGASGANGTGTNGIVIISYTSVLL